MLAILSDIHANLEALQVVLDDASKRGIDQTYCLGDTVGYGPDPEACTSLIRDFDVVLRGSFDDQVFADNRNSLKEIRRIGQWTHDRLSKDSLAFLAGCPTRYSDAKCTYSHASPTDNGYLFPEDIYNQAKMDQVFDRLDGVLYCGHSHVAGIHTVADYMKPETIDYEYKLDGTDVIINVGSVGQPRDGDKRACYVIVDGDRVRFIRLDYDVDTTIRKLRDGGFGPTYWDI